MESLLRSFLLGGPLGNAMVIAAAIGAPAALVAAILNRRKAGFVVGVVALVAATTSAGIGALGVALERVADDAKLVDLPTETARLRARREGYADAKRWARAGLALGVVPLFGGLAGVLAPVMRRRKPRPQSIRMPRSFRSQARAEFTTKTGTTSLTASALAVLAFAACAVVWALPLPPPNLPLDAPEWDAREAIDEMKLGPGSEACNRLEAACARHCDPENVPYIGGAVAECFELRLEAAEESPDRAALLEELARSPLPLGNADRQRLRRDVDATPH